MDYLINHKVYSSITVECSAQSVNGSQYLSSTSKTKPAVFTLDKGAASLSPTDGTVSSTSFKVV